MEGMELDVAPRPANATYLAFTRGALLKSPRTVVETIPVENLDKSTKDALLNSREAQPDALEQAAVALLVGEPGRHRRHDDAVAQLDRADASGGEEGVACH